MKIYREAIVCYLEKDKENLDVVYEDVENWEVHNGALVLYHNKRGVMKDVTVIPLGEFQSCDIRESEDEEE